MHFDFWNDRWREGQIGFHLDRPNPSLLRHADVLGAPPGRVFVPLCGKSQDLTWLMHRGHDVLGVEFVPQAVQQYFDELGVRPVDTRVGDLPARRHGRITLAVGDFFALTASAVAPVASIYDRAALVAVPPAVRPAYARQLAALVPSGASLLLINFVHDMGAGPPFSVPDTELQDIFAGLFAIEKRAARDILAAESQFRARGATYMLEQVWQGTRLA